MKRNRFGINVDEGVALQTADELEQLYVDTDIEVGNRLLEWLNSGEQAILFGGQIGCGKTTLITYLFESSSIAPDIMFRLDKGSLNISSIDAWANVFIEILRFSVEQGASAMAVVPEIFSTFLGDSPEAWLETLSEVRLEVFSSSAIEKNNTFNKLLESFESQLPRLLLSLIQDLQQLKTRPLLFLASGVDKFEPSTAAYYALQDILSTLSSFKTLFEVNAVHLFFDNLWMKGIERLFLRASKPFYIEQMLQKRLGRYAEAYTEEIPLIAQYSGGVPRQALRILDLFLALRKKTSDFTEAITAAVGFANQDFFSFGQKPESDLMRAVADDRALETSLISLPGDSATAKRAVFGNWILLTGPMGESRWEAVINPLIKGSFFEVNPDEPERVLLNRYARQHDMSAMGLDFDPEFSNWQQALAGQLDVPISLNVTEILDLISHALLSLDRQDRIIIAYENKDVANAVRAYLEANANAYEYQIWEHHVIRDDLEVSPLFQILRIISEKAADIYSFDFENALSEEALEELNLRRDFFIDLQLIWWIQKDRLNDCFKKWTQLRQLFQLFILEEDLSRALSEEEIEADIKFMEELAEIEGTAPFLYVRNLQKVLAYLKGGAHG